MTSLSSKWSLAEAEVGQALDPEDVSGQLPLSEVALLQEMSLQQLLLQERMRREPYLRRSPRRSSKPGGQPRSALRFRLTGTEAAVRISEEAGLQVLGCDGSTSQIRHRTAVILQI